MTVPARSAESHEGKPWGMTAKEFFHANRNQDFIREMHGAKADIPAEELAARKVMDDAKAKADSAGLSSYDIDGSNGEIKSVKKRKLAEDVKAAEREYYDHVGKNRESNQRSLHKNVVQAALAAGKPVPPHVLADYPDLATTITPPPEGPPPGKDDGAGEPASAPVGAAGDRAGTVTEPADGGGGVMPRHGPLSDSEKAELRANVLATHAAAATGVRPDKNADRGIEFHHPIASPTGQKVDLKWNADGSERIEQQGRYRVITSRTKEGGLQHELIDTTTGFQAAAGYFRGGRASIAAHDGSGLPIDTTGLPADQVAEFDRRHREAVNKGEARSVVQEAVVARQAASDERMRQAEADDRKAKGDKDAAFAARTGKQRIEPQTVIAALRGTGLPVFQPAQPRSGRPQRDGFRVKESIFKGHRGHTMAVDYVGTGDSEKTAAMADHLRGQGFVVERNPNVPDDTTIYVHKPHADSRAREVVPPPVPADGFADLAATVGGSVAGLHRQAGLPASGANPPTAVDKPATAGNTPGVGSQSAAPKPGGSGMDATTEHDGEAKHVADRVADIIRTADSDYSAKVVRHKNGDLKVYLSMKGSEKGAVVIHQDGTVEIPSGLGKHLLRDKAMVRSIEALRAVPEDRGAWQSGGVDLAKVARDYRAGKVVDFDLIVQAVKHGHLTESEAMNRDY